LIEAQASRSFASTDFVWERRPHPGRSIYPPRHPASTRNVREESHGSARRPTSCRDPAADVAGYSRLMGVDEEGTAQALREHRAAGGLAAKLLIADYRQY
jgi:hypothetical protein